MSMSDSSIMQNLTGIAGGKGVLVMRACSRRDNGLNDIIYMEGP